jgi:hypothetical protein
MATETLGPRACEFLLSEAPGTLSRESIAILSGAGVLTAGTVLGQITKGAATATGAATTAGNGDFVAESVSATTAAQVGAYTLVALSATKALLYAPDGAFLGQYTIGDAYSANGIAFDTEGTWAAGDTATITVAIAAGSGKLKPYDDDNTDGSDVAVGILLSGVDATDAEQKAVMIARNAEVATDKLVWASSNDANDKTAGLADLAALNILARS